MELAPPPLVEAVRYHASRAALAVRTIGLVPGFPAEAGRAASSSAFGAKEPPASFPPPAPFITVTPIPKKISKLSRRPCKRQPGPLSAPHKRGSRTSRVASVSVQPDGAINLAPASP